LIGIAAGHGSWAAQIGDWQPEGIPVARFSYRWGYWTWFEQSYNDGGLDAQYGLGGLAPYSASLGNGGLPQIWVNEFPAISPPLFQPSPEGQNGYQIPNFTANVQNNIGFGAGILLRFRRAFRQS
jgi:hypothetical protein